MKMKFDILFENTYEIFQQGGYRTGDRVIFRKDALKHDYFKNKGQNFIDLIKSCITDGFDLNLRVTALKSIYPTTTQNYRGGTESPDCIYADVMIEYAPGLYRTPMTVPIEVLDRVDDGINTGPVPNSIRRKSKVHGPEKTKANDEDGSNRNLTDKNVQNPFASKTQNDSKPSKNWEPLPTK